MKERGQITSIYLRDQQAIEDWEAFKENCSMVLKTDTCYVVQQLIKAFNQSLGAVPSSQDPIVIQTLKQHIQINLGCEFNYNVSKARRSPLTKVARDRNYLLPEIIEQWDHMTEKNKEYWRERLIEKGILPKRRARRKRKAPSQDKQIRKRKKKSLLSRIRNFWK